MKIVQVTPNYPPSMGGLQNCARELSERLARMGHDVEVFTSDISCKKGRIRSKRNLKINYLKSIELAHTPIIPSLLPRLLKMPKDSIMHVHVTKAFVPEIAYLVSKIKKIPYVAHFHLDVGRSGRFGFLLSLYKKLILKKVLKSADKIIILAKEYKVVMDRKYNISDNTVVIPNGVADKFFLNRDINNTPERVNLLFVGRLSVQKDVAKLIEAVSLVRNKVTLHIVGEGELKSEIINLIADKNLKSVILHGKKEGQELLEFYRAASIFLLASKSEGSPLALLEAMAAEIPIIASDVIGNREFVKDIGILVNPPTPKNFAGEIDRLIEDENLRRRLAKKGREKAKKYDWNRIVARFESIYKEVLNESNKK